jgi:hypothetical protein
MPDLLPGSIVEANDTPPTVGDVEPDAFTFTGTTFGVTTTGGTYNDCAAVFTAPTTGRVVIHYCAQMTNSATASTVVSPVVRAGGVIGSGAVVVAASDDEGLTTQNNVERRSGAHLLVSGLTPGATYNVRLEHRVSSGATTGTVRRRSVTVCPAT